MTSCPNSVVLASTGATAALPLATNAWLPQLFGPPAFAPPWRLGRSFLHSVSAPPRHAENGACVREQLGASRLLSSREGADTLACPPLCDRLDGTAQAFVSVGSGPDDALVTSSTKTPSFRTPVWPAIHWNGPVHGCDVTHHCLLSACATDEAKPTRPQGRRGTRRQPEIAGALLRTHGSDTNHSFTFHLAETNFRPTAAPPSCCATVTVGCTGIHGLVP